ncbi:MAG: DUF4870 domain-containing protein [Micrococcaceae bacterium]
MTTITNSKARLEDPNHFRPSEDKDWATLAHFGGAVGPIPPYLIHRYLGKYGAFTKSESKEAMDFSLPLFLLVLLFLLLSNIPHVGSIFKWSAFGVWAFLIAFSVIGGVVASRGKPYRYPFNLSKLWRIVTGRQQRKVWTPEEIAALKAQKEAAARKKELKKLEKQKVREEKIKARAARAQLRKAKAAQAQQRKVAQKAAQQEAKARAAEAKARQAQLQEAQTQAALAQQSQLDAPLDVTTNTNVSTGTTSTHKAPARLRSAKKPNVPTMSTMPAEQTTALSDATQTATLSDTTQTSTASEVYDFDADDEEPLLLRKDLKNK